MSIASKKRRAPRGRRKVGRSEGGGKQATLEIALDTSTLSDCASDAVLREALSEALRAGGMRLTIPLPAFDEAIDAAAPNRIAQRGATIVALSNHLGRHFGFSQHIGDILRLERRQKAIRSIPRTPRDFTGAILGLLRTGEYLDDLGHLRLAIQAQQRKDERFERDRNARTALATTAAPFFDQVNEMLDDPREHPDFWKSVFVSNVSRDRTDRARMKRYPQQYATAVMMGAYGALIGFGALYAAAGGRHAGLLRAPRRSDWIDGWVAACSAHAAVFLSEDAGQRRKVNYVAEKFGLVIRAVSARQWIEN